MDLYEVMRVAGQARAFRSDPVPDEVLHRVLDHARFAANGGNRQGWHVVVIKDAALRSAVRDLARRELAAFVAAITAGKVPAMPEHLLERGRQLVESLGEVPVLLLVLVDLDTLAVSDARLPRQSIAGDGSIYTFVQNLLLALRNEELAAALTTLVVPTEPELKELFGIPERYAVAALVAVGRPAAALPTRLKRRPVEEFATVDGFAGPPLSR
jgi:nitroreductase